MDYGIETRCIHGAENLLKDHAYGALSVPLFQTATFAHPGVGRSTGYDYTRESNPTRAELEKIMSALEGACDSLACASGMAAVLLCMELFSAGDHVVCTEDLYGGSVRMFDTVCRERGVEFTSVDSGISCC